MGIRDAWRRQRAARPDPRVRWHFSRGMLASCLWDLGEDGLAEQALSLDDAELTRIQRIGVTYCDPTYALPISGQRVTNRHVMVLAAITELEGRLRPPARERARPAKDRPARFAPTPPDPEVRP